MLLRASYSILGLSLGSSPSWLHEKGMGIVTGIGISIRIDIGIGIGMGYGMCGGNSRRRYGKNEEHTKGRVCTSIGIGITIRALGVALFFCRHIAQCH